MTFGWCDWAVRIAVAVVFATATLAAKRETMAEDGDGHVVQAAQCHVRFSKEVQVPALETGQVAEVNVALNDAVDAGAPIARLDGSSLLVLQRKGRARRDQARRDAQDLTSIRHAEISLRYAETELETSRSIQNDVRGAIPRRQVQMLKLAVELAQLEVDKAQTDQERARTEVELREAELSVIDKQLRNLQALSPIGGIVLDIMRSEGEWIEKGQTIATIGRMDRLHVRALLSSKQISPAQCRGLPVSVHWMDANTNQPRALRGRVLSVDPQMLPDGQFRLHAEIVNQRDSGNQDHWQLQPGAAVQMKVYVNAMARRDLPTLNR